MKIEGTIFVQHDALFLLLIKSSAFKAQRKKGSVERKKDVVRRAK